jgi:hypothetical protein
MLRRRLLSVIAFALLALCGTISAQEPQDNAVRISYNGIEFSYVPEAFGAVLPSYDEGTPYQADAPYFANAAPHTSFKFMRPNPNAPDTNWVGELRVYRIADLEAYAEPTYQEVVNQLRSLDTRNLSAHVNVGANARLPTLPFMPVLNATQVFWTHPRAVHFENATGIEYYPYYSVVPEPIIEGQVIYAYQAITADGLYYLSFSMPIETGLLETTIPGNINLDAFVANYPQYLLDIFSVIDNADPVIFAPTSLVLTRFIESIAVK